MPEEGRARSPLIRSISSKDLRRKPGRKSAPRELDETVTFDVGDRTTEAEEHLLQDLDNILHRKLHIADSSCESGSPEDSPSFSGKNGNKIDATKSNEESGDEDDAEDDDEDEEFANVDEIDGPISPSSSSGSLKDLGRSSSKKINQVVDSQDQKIDYNLPVDDSYQKQLDKRAEEIANGFYIHPISKATLKWTVKDFYSLYEEIPEWFCARDYCHLQKARSCFEKRFQSDKFLTDEVYAKSSVRKLIQSLEESFFDVSALLSLLHITMGYSNSHKKIADHIATIKRNNLIILPYLSTVIKAFKKHATFCRDKSSNLKQYTTLLFYSSTVLFFSICCCIDSNGNSTYDISNVNLIFDENHMLTFLTSYIEHWRWSSRLSMRIRNIIALLHKVILLQFGDLQMYKKTKTYVLKKHSISLSNDNPSILNISPLDYHGFREDVTTRFPSFVPPPSIIPEGFDNSNSLSQFLEIPRPKSKNAINMNLSVPEIHIATPAPSPSSSPVPQLSGTKLRKSFQTNMAYPTLYPSDDENASDDLSKLMSVPQDTDNDNIVPFNIREATEILSKSIHVKLSTKQLWHERELFMAQERGWNNNETLPDPEKYKNYTDCCEEAERMNRIEKYYEESLPSLSSLVYVLLQTVESNIKNQSYISSEVSKLDTADSLLPQLEVTRSKEIVMNSACAILHLLLKWFKLSHVLKFEHLSVLIYDFKFINISTNLLHNYSENYIDRVFDKMIKVPHSFWRECGSYAEPYAVSVSDILQDSQDPLDLRFLNTEYYLLQILNKTIGRKTQRLKELPLSVGSLFKKYYQVFNLDIYHPILKLIRELTPFKNKKWKSDHMELISGVYLYEKLKLTDNWVTGKDISGELNDACGQEIALRALLQFYNFTHYKASMEHFGYHDKSDTSFFSKESELLTTSY
ncbi:LAFE_0F05798g1_1 [Lachancea fermentati]|uniref:LAFE_0F05798g1_1 n=1 Tax=Lachancea fermentati TaxID=4955 RepID=A0A1G4MF89_LACFM|nr:LAFE_0F05798g1_1 [Lachancea fermentati]